MKLPQGIHLDQYKTQAKDLLKQIKDARPNALSRLQQYHPEYSVLAATGKIGLADAQLVLARELGYPSWAKFKNDLIFRNAVQAMADGDLQRLESLLDRHPFLITYKAHFGEPYERGYFAEATLLHHVAGNPDIHPIPHNILDITRLLLSRHFDIKVAQYTIGLILTSRQASEAKVALPLIDLLEGAGARFDLEQPDLLNSPLLNLAPDTALKLIDRGAKVSLRHAAALGQLERMREMLQRGVSQEDLNYALAFASIRGQKEAAELLLGHGARGDVLLSYGPPPRSALHEAANRGFEEIVRAIVGSGVNIGVVEPQWNGTPAGWAEEGGFPSLAKWLRGLD